MKRSEWCGDKPSGSTETGKRPSLPPNFKPGWDIATDYLTVHSATTWRKSALIRAGGYDTSLPCNEAVDMYLKVGDFAKQVYHPSVVAIKYVNHKGKFRALINQRSKELNRKMLYQTLERRYGFSLN